MNCSDEEDSSYLSSLSDGYSDDSFSSSSDGDSDDTSASSSDGDSDDTSACENDEEAKAIIFKQFRAVTEELSQERTDENRHALKILQHACHI